LRPANEIAYGNQYANDIGVIYLNGARATMAMRTVSRQAPSLTISDASLVPVLSVSFSTFAWIRRSWKALQDIIKKIPIPFALTIPYGRGDNRRSAKPMSERYSGRMKLLFIRDRRGWKARAFPV
jgi:hypothetical protein